MDLNHMLTKLIEKNDLTTEEARYAMEFMTSEDCRENSASIGAILALLSSKGESVQEVTTFAECLREKGVPISISVRAYFCNYKLFYYPITSRYDRIRKRYWTLSALAAMVHKR